MEARKINDGKRSSKQSPRNSHGDELRKRNPVGIAPIEPDQDRATHTRTVTLNWPGKNRQGEWKSTYQFGRGSSAWPPLGFLRQNPNPLLNPNLRLLSLVTILAEKLASTEDRRGREGGG